MASKRACLYLRTSKQDQHPENQRAELERLVQARGLEIVEVYEEQVSAVKNRPEYNRMMKDAHRGKFDTLIIWALDRLGRSMSGNLQAVLELDRLGVTVVSLREPWLDTSSPVRSLLVAIFSWVAEQERQRIADRTRCGLDQVKKSGVRLGRPPARVNPNELALLRAQGMSVKMIAKKLGIGVSTLHRVLKTEALKNPMPAAQAQVPGNTIPA
jgi:DNA invertase Pin-like site-specific DNA recombinase